MRISDWSSDVCSSDLRRADAGKPDPAPRNCGVFVLHPIPASLCDAGSSRYRHVFRSRPRTADRIAGRGAARGGEAGRARHVHAAGRSEEHTSELQSLMRISYAVFCLKKKNKQKIKT